MTEKDNVSYGFYYIDNDFLDYLAEKDSHVPKHDYEDEGRARKFYCGPVFDDTGINYFVPVSHQVKDMRLSNIESYGMLIRDDKNKPMGCLDFRFAIPCPFPQCLTPYEPKGHAIKQAEFCNKYKGFICREAKMTHQNILSDDYPHLTESSTQRGKVVENELWEYEDILDAKKSQTEQNASAEKNTSAEPILSDTKTETSIINSTTVSNNNFAQRVLKADMLTENIETPENGGYGGLG